MAGMQVAGLEQAELSIARGRLSDAVAQLVAPNVDPAAEKCRARLRASVYALAGDDAGVAGSVAPDLLACRSVACVNAHFETLSEPPQASDYLTAGVVLTWTMEAAGAYELFGEAHDRAIAEQRFHLAVGVRERLAHHAVLFGDLEIARGALDDAMRFCTARGLLEWFLRCAAAAARLAFDEGDSERAAQLVARARKHAFATDAFALLAPAGAALAAKSGDEAALAEWNSPQILATALGSQVRESAIAATIALLCGIETMPDATVSIALRRSLLQASGLTGAIEFFSMAARYGDLEEARLAAEALGAFVAPNRKYLKAHAMLARAHLLFRCGERAAWIDHAGDAARTFSAIGMRRWTNEAMLLLVRQEDDNAPRRRRGRPMACALTGREQQVAHLIRRGARNREVAAALQISEHTVERHVSSILGRLGLRSRWQIVDPKDLPED
jgi:DNA-binding CsgD family transcriptional regulator